MIWLYNLTPQERGEVLDQGHLVGLRLELLYRTWGRVSADPVINMQIVAILEIHIIIQQRVETKYMHDTISWGQFSISLDHLLITNHVNVNLSTFRCGLSTFLRWMRAVCAWERNKLSGWKTARDKLFPQKMEKQENGRSVTNRRNYKGEGEVFLCDCKIMTSVKTFNNVGGTIMNWGR